MRDKLVCGLQNKSIHRKLLAEADLTLKCAFEASQGMEAAYHQASELQGSKTPQDIHSVHVLKQPCFVVAKQTMPKKNVTSDPRPAINVGKLAM